MFLPEGVINLVRLRSPERLMGDHGFLPPVAAAPAAEVNRQPACKHTQKTPPSSALSLFREKNTPEGITRSMSSCPGESSLQTQTIN